MKRASYLLLLDGELPLLFEEDFTFFSDLDGLLFIARLDLSLREFETVVFGLLLFSTRFDLWIRAFETEGLDLLLLCL